MVHNGIPDWRAHTLLNTLTLSRSHTLSAHSSRAQEAYTPPHGPLRTAGLFGIRMNSPLTPLRPSDLADLAACFDLDLDLVTTDLRSKDNAGPLQAAERYLLNIREYRRIQARAEDTS